MADEKKGFLATTTGVLTAVAALLTAVTGVIALLVTTQGPQSAPTGGTKTTSTGTITSDAADALVVWSRQINELCRAQVAPVTDAMSDMSGIQTTPTDPAFGAGLRELSLRYAALVSQINSVPLPGDSGAATWRALYEQRAAHLLRASQRWDGGDIQGAGAALLAFSDTSHVVQLGESRGIAACP